MPATRNELLCILGPTAAGKTAFAAHLALTLGSEIISADSRQVYRTMDIGTGKDLADYVVKGERVPVHLVDIVDAGFEYNVYLFKQDFLRVFQDISGRDMLPVLCGGSGLYVESVIRDYRLLHVPRNEELRADLGKKDFGELKDMLRLYGPLHNQTDTGNRKRLERAIEIAMYQAGRPGEEKGEELRSMVIGIRPERMERRKRITERLQERLKAGMVEEVEDLIRRGIGHEKLEYYGLEYRYISLYLRNELTYEEMVGKLNTAIHQFAKRQMTYFRGMERRGTEIHWMEASLPLEEKLEKALDLCREKSLIL